MNRNFTFCNDAPEAPGGFDTFETSDALTGSAAVRFGIASSKTDNSLSVSEIRVLVGKSLIFSELRFR